MNKIAKSIWVWFTASVSLILIFIPYLLVWLFTFWFDKKHYISQKFTQLWSRLYVKLFFGDIELINAPLLVRGKPAIVVSNHQSLADILVLFHLYAYFIWVSKIENFRAPILGQVMYLNDYISLTRENPRSFPKMFQRIGEALAANRHVMMFPEGTRSKSGEIGRFKEGAFKAAIENKAAIIPIVLDGTGKSVSKKGGINEKTKIIVKVLDPVLYENFPSYEPSELKEYIKNIIAKELSLIRRKA